MVNIDDLNKKMDISAEIYVEAQSAILKIIRDFDQTVPLYIHREEGELFLNAFLPRDMDLNSYKPIFSAFNIEERIDYFRGIEKLYEENIIELINNLDSIEGLIIAGEYMKDGYFVIKCFMHHSLQKAFTDAITTKLMKHNFIEKLDIKPVNKMLENNFNIKMKSIIISMPYEEFKEDRVAIILHNNNSIGQITSNFPEAESRFKMIIYSNDDLHNGEGIRVISKDDGVYVTDIENEMLFYLNKNVAKMSNKLKFPRIFRFLWVNGEKVYANIILPEIRAREYLNAIASLQIELKKINLVTLEDYSEFNLENMGKYLL